MTEQASPESSSPSVGRIAIGAGKDAEESSVAAESRRSGAENSAREDSRDERLHGFLGGLAEVRNHAGIKLHRRG